MTIVIDERHVLTTDHAASSYGQPVLIRDGVAYGSDDMYEDGVFGVTPATEPVLLFARREQLKAYMTHGGLMLDAESVALVERFLTLGGLADD